MKSTAAKYAAITCDIVGSRKIDEFRRKRDQKLRGISRLHVQKKWILSDYAITAWDEFEGILSRPANLPAVLVDLRRHFHPFELWIGIGMGEVTEPHRKPVNIFAGGEAFERAREAINKLKAKRSKAGVLTSFVTGNEMFDLIGNTIYHLHDSLLESISTKQWKTINVLMETSGQELAAKKLGLNKSTVSRNLRRGFWWQIQDTQVAMERIIDAYFPIAR
ncbi:MAG: SatD family protein [Candidatus Sulfotelmatobacter sp.]